MSTAILIYLVTAELYRYNTDVLELNLKEISD